MSASGSVPVVITGMGAVTPLGDSVSSFWDSLIAGRYAIAPIKRFDASVFQFGEGGEIPEFELGGRAGAVVGRDDRALRFAAKAVDEAWSGSGLSNEGLLDEVAVVLATNFGSVELSEAALTGGPCSGRDRSGLGFQAAADAISRIWGFGGPCVALSLSCASGAAAVGYGMDLIRQGRCRAAVCCGYDAISRFAWSGLCALRTMTKDRIRPFDLNRDGTVFSEGAGAMVLEAADSAAARGAEIHAELLGHGMNNNAFHLAAPSKEGEGLAAVMRMALHDAGIKAEEVSHVNAHGTGTKHNDVSETLAIKAVFGRHAEKVAVNSIKSCVGHVMGAAGSLEAIATALSLREGLIPPTMGLVTPDPECDLDYTPNAARKLDARVALSNSSGIGGCNSALVLGRHKA